MAGVRTGISGQVNNNIVTDGLVYYLDPAYKISYSGTGTTITDIEGNLNATMNGTAFSSVNNGVLDFDGTDDDLDTPYNDVFNLCNITNFTINVFIKVEDFVGDYNAIMAQWPQQSVNDAWILCHNSGKLSWVWAPYSVNGYFIQNSSTLTQNVWTMVSIVKEGSTHTLYEDGVQVATGTNSGTKSSSYQMQMGRYAGTSLYLNAKIGPAQIYHKALSVQDLKQNYQAQKERFGL